MKSGKRPLGGILLLIIGIAIILGGILDIIFIAFIPNLIDLSMFPEARTANTFLILSGLFSIILGTIMALSGAWLAGLTKERRK